MNFESFCSRFEAEEDCIRELFSLRWPDGYRCPRCRHSDYYLISSRKLPLFECKSCRTQTSLIAGTIMQGSRTPLRLWFQAIYMHAQQKGINALQLSQIIKVTYKTAWLICHKIRNAMSSQDSARLLGGSISVSNGVYSRQTIPSSEWHEKEQPLLIGAETDGTFVKRIKLKHCSKAGLKSHYDAPSAKSFISKHVRPESKYRISVLENRGINANPMLLKLVHQAGAWLAWTFRGIGPKHLQVYLDHFAYLWNRRSQSKRLREELFQACAHYPVITYPELTGSANNRSRSLKRERSEAHSSSLAS